MIYLDANVFIYAILDRGERGKMAAELIKDIREGKKEACTSALTWDEVLYQVQKHNGKEDAVMAGKAFLNMKNLHIIPANPEILWKANALIESTNLKPRDAIHAASYFHHNATALISEDSDFDQIKEIKRKWVI